MSVLLLFYLNTVMLIHVCIIYGCFCAKIAELSSCHRQMQFKQPNICPSWASTENVNSALDTQRLNSHSLTPKSVRMQNTLEKVQQLGGWGAGELKRETTGLLHMMGTCPRHPPRPLGGLTSRNAPPPSQSLPWRWLFHEDQGFCLNSLQVSLPESQL